MPDRDDSDDLILIERATREAGNIARRYFGSDYKKWDKGKGQPVTDADIAVDRFLHDALLSARPEYGWLSEESVDDPARQTAEHVFVVDPIDGTTAFLKNRPHFSISVAIVRSRRPVAGIVFNPITGECYSARAGGGATLNGEPVHVSEATQIDGCRMLGPRDMFQHPAWNTPPNRPWPEMAVDTRSSIAYRMALVAAGTFDAAIALSPKHDWDLAAGDLIVHEAGGLVTTHTGEVMRYNGPSTLQPSFVCAGPALHALILNQVRHLTLPGGRSRHGRA